MMQLHVKGKNLEVNESIRRYAERKLRKLDRRVTDSTRVEVELAVERNPSIAESQVAEATVRLEGRTLHARKASRDMKAAIDELADKLIRQVHDVRDKRVSRRKHAGEPAPADVTEAAETQ
jgi:ribosome hibernation promoting factor